LNELLLWGETTTTKTTHPLFNKKKRGKKATFYGISILLQSTPGVFFSLPSKAPPGMEDAFGN
jgi:hypothetical protein